MESTINPQIEQDRYELFRRAILERDIDAWNKIDACYRPLLISWAKRWARHRNAVLHDEDLSDIADQAFARAWMTILQAQCALFASLEAILRYLHACVISALLDHTCNINNVVRKWRAYSCDSTSLQLMSAFLISGEDENHYEARTGRDFSQNVADLFASIEKWNSNLNQWRSELYGPRSGYAC